MRLISTLFAAALLAFSVGVVSVNAEDTNMASVSVISNEAQRLNEEGLKKTFVGRTAYAAVRTNRGEYEYARYLSKDGKVFTRISIPGRTIMNQGTWSIEGDQLCLVWFYGRSANRKECRSWFARGPMYVTERWTEDYGVQVTKVVDGDAEGLLQ